MVRQGLVWLGRVLVVLVLLAAVLFAGSRWLGRDSAELRLMEQASPTPGRNAFAALWLMPYDIPPDEIEAIAAQDVRRFAARDPADTSEFVSSAEGRYPRAADSSGGSPEWCDWRGNGCLAHVRANRDALAKALAERAPVIDRMRALSGVGHHRDLFKPVVHRPLSIPIGTYSRELLTAQALTVVDGDAAGAMADLCTTVSTWRPLAANSDSLIATMLAMSIVESSSRLLADVLAEQPDGQPIPSTCKTAYVPPVPAEYLPCTAMRGELGLVDGAAKTMDREALENPWGWLVYDRQMTRVRTANHLAHSCKREVQEAALRGEPVTVPWAGGLATPLCAGNLAGCLVTEIAAPAYTDYLHRTQDHAARLQAMELLLRLHENTDDRSYGERLAAMPADSIPTGRKIEVVDTDGGEALRLELFWQGQGRYWEVPLTAPTDPAVSPPPTGGGA
ncbi:hypothetical protein SAMN02745674_00727 [Lysobacter spongiicola DSM 21749]|uniref:Uncharacterized protein n=1 Tax=Lysobacter spongiicola DSM 21749 TaxID=1122188 RepID=A0A1T4N4Y5_9GAMM|nr:hypothetical protein SAMN02745674_00727 [Lysobacter spongiicola DSM 21749]